MYVHQVSERFSFGNDPGAGKEYTEKIDSAFSAAKRKELKQVITGKTTNNKNKQVIKT